MWYHSDEQDQALTPWSCAPHQLEDVCNFEDALLVGSALITLLRRADTAKNAKWCPISEVHISGKNQNDHHGTKHTGTSGGFSLKYADHKQYENESGTKLEFLLRDAKTEAVVHYQFFSGIAVSNAGTWSSNEYLPMGAFADTQSALLWQIESNSSWQWEISDIADMLYLKTSGPNDQDHDWS